MQSYLLTLFISGQTPLSTTAQANLARLRKDYLCGTCHVTVVDVMNEPEEAELHKILATPTLVKSLPAPVRRIVGDLSDLRQVAAALGLVKQAIEQ